ncbi:uncharacterized protein METZ01_LOCUS102222, partial [marine metagenome]
VEPGELFDGGPAAPNPSPDPAGGPTGHRADNQQGNGHTDKRSHTNRPSRHRKDNRGWDGDHQTGSGGR